MRRSGVSVLLLVLVVANCTGCVLIEPIRPVARYAKGLLTFRGTDYDDPTEEEDPYWITDAAEEARGDRPRERDPDQWYKKYFMSEKARSIERNLGFD